MSGTPMKQKETDGSISSMSKHTGSCSCRDIQFEVEGEPLFVGLCHCLNCQKSTSSAFSTNLVIPRTSFKLNSGEVRTYHTDGGSLRKFCGNCSCLMWTESPKFESIVVVKAGVMDGGGIAKFTPATEAFTSRRPGWVGEVPGAKQFVDAFHA